MGYIIYSELIPNICSVVSFVEKIPLMETLSQNLSEVDCNRPCDSPKCTYVKCARRKRFSPNNKMVKHASEVKKNLAALKASLDTVNYKIDNLQRYFTNEQVALWKIDAKYLTAKIGIAEMQLTEYERIGIKP